MSMLRDRTRPGLDGKYSARRGNHDRFTPARGLLPDHLLDHRVRRRHADPGGGPLVDLSSLPATLSPGAVAVLDKSQKSECASSEAGGRRGLAVMAAHKQRKFSSRGRSPAPESRQTDSAPIRATVPLIEQ